MFSFRGLRHSFWVSCKYSLIYPIRYALTDEDELTYYKQHSILNINGAPSSLFRFALCLDMFSPCRLCYCGMFVVQSAMSQEMASQPSDDVDSERSPRSDDEMEDDDDINHYYNSCDGEEHDHDRRKEDDPEYFEYQLLNVEDVERLLNENVEALSQSIKVNSSGLICLPLCIVVCFLCATVVYFILCFMFRPSSLKSSIVLCYNINKLTCLLNLHKQLNVD